MLSNMIASSETSEQRQSSTTCRPRSSPLREWFRDVESQVNNNSTTTQQHVVSPTKPIFVSQAHEERSSQLHLSATPSEEEFRTSPS